MIWRRPGSSWLKLHVNGKGLADAPPSATESIDHVPMLTTEMAAATQGFPASWTFSGRKTASYRQIGNALPPPVACAVGASIHAAIDASRSVSRSQRTRLLRAV